MDFPVPLPSEQIKHFHEFFALAVLRYYQPTVFNDYHKVDAPDLQSVDKKHGVEVTCATSKEDAVVSGNYLSYRKADNDSKRAQLEENILKHGGKIEQNGITYPVKDSSMERKTICEAINKKNEKLIEYKENGFETLSLFVYYEEPLCPLTETQVRHLFEETKGHQTYETVYLCAPSVLIVYNYPREELLILPIPREDFDSLGVIARMTVDGLLDSNSPIWKI